MIPVKGRISPEWEAARTQIQERLQAIERELSGGRQVFHAPAGPTFGSGSGTVQSSGAGSTGGTVGGGVVDHGLLIGLGDNDHPQYSLREDQSEVIAHVHSEQDLIGLESRFIGRGEQVTPEPHFHIPADLNELDTEFVRRDESAEAHVHGEQDLIGLESRFVVRNEGPEQHSHTLSEVADFNLAEMMLWQEVLGG